MLFSGNNLNPKITYTYTLKKCSELKMILNSAMTAIFVLLIRDLVISADYMQNNWFCGDKYLIYTEEKSPYSIYAKRNLMLYWLLFGMSQHKGPLATQCQQKINLSILFTLYHIFANVFYTDEVWRAEGNISTASAKTYTCVFLTRIYHLR